MTAERRLGRYILRERIGRGGFSTIYRAWDPVMGSDVALKLFQPGQAADARSVERFRREARSLARLRHPNIVAFYGVDEADDQIFIVMELIEGDTLASLLHTTEGGWPLERVAAVLAPLCSALDYLHGQGLVHRDIKASNVMVDRGGRVVLMDLGIVGMTTASDLQLTMTAAAMGTPQTMAPEQVQGQPAGPPADIYALGVLVYQLLTGHPPFEGAPLAVMHAQVYDAPPDLRSRRPGLPEPVYQVIAQALAKDPAQRPASAEAIVAACQPAPSPAPAELPLPAGDAAASATAMGSPPSSGGASAALRWPAAVRQHRWITAVLCTVLAALALGLAAARFFNPLGKSHAGQVVSDVEVYYIGAWAQAQAPLQVCFNVWSRPAGGFHLEVRTEVEQRLIGSGPLTPAGPLGENQCLTLPNQLPLDPGSLRVAVLDEAGDSLASRTFAVVGPVQLSGIAGWASGDGSLLACAAVSSAPPFPTLHLSVSRQDGTGGTLLGPARQMTDAALPCLTLPPHGQLKPGVYRASVVDAEGREVGRATADLIGGLELRDAGGWAAGDAALGVCFGKGSELATASLAARVVRRDGSGEGWLSQPASADDAGAAGMVCLNVDPAEPIEAGAYDVAIVDGLGRVVRETTVTLPAP